MKLYYNIKHTHSKERNQPCNKGIDTSRGHVHRYVRYQILLVLVVLYFVCSVKTLFSFHGDKKTSKILVDGVTTVADVKDGPETMNETRKFPIPVPREEKIRADGDAVAPDSMKAAPGVKKQLQVLKKTVPGKKAAPAGVKKESKDVIGLQNQSILSTLRPNEGMSACLVVKDESTLPEWLAYHYLVGPLRYLVVVVDRSSKTSPLELLHKWNTTTDMNIVVVEDIHQNTFSSKEFMSWQAEQYKNCIRHHWKNNRTWAFIIDTDEYIVFNPPNKTRRTAHPLRKKLPRDLGSKTILQVIEEEKENYPWAFGKCIFMPRVTFSDMEEGNRTLLYESVPEGFNPKKFNTLRFFRHDYLIHEWHFSPGKSLFDLSRFNQNDLHHLTNMWHFPLEECVDSTLRRNKKLSPSLSKSIFKVNHYSGTKEAFFQRQGFGNDFPGDWYTEKFEKMSKANRFISYQTKSWLLRFVEQVGFEKAMQLLKGTGEWNLTEEENKIE